LAPDGAHELRGLPSGRGRVVRGNGIDEAVEAALSLSDGSVYWCLNPIAEGAERANKKTVVARRWLLVDVDSVRPKDVSATESEKAKCGEVAVSIYMHLIDEGWPLPVVVDSGNGWHLLYRIDLPNDPLSAQIIKATTYALAAQFDDEFGTVDKATHDAPRISKLPGTMARKGPDIESRPHRLAKLSFVPDTIGVVSVDQLSV
jgi:hypothetical protein